ncbi:MAG TPA: hypothetical protein VFE38_10320 [Edaphobacter sp.]|nr:hypothetical protein [Edaphobacter sp.]
MKISYGLLLAPALAIVFCASCSAQTAAQPAAQAPAPAAAVPTPSSIMQPALHTLQQTIDSLQPEKWKGPNAMRDEASNNIDSIRRDLSTTLPSLLTAADAAPDSITKVLPAYRNVEALYDVLLRVDQTSRYTAPNQQVAALEHAMTQLEASRRALAEHIQTAATAREKQVVDLETKLRAIPPTPAAVPCTPPPAPKKRKRRHTTTKSQSTAKPTSSNTQNATH